MNWFRILVPQLSTLIGEAPQIAPESRDSGGNRGHSHIPTSIHLALLNTCESVLSGSNCAHKRTRKTAPFPPKSQRPLPGEPCETGLKCVVRVSASSPSSGESILAMRPAIQPVEGGSIPTSPLCRADWRVRPCDLSTVQSMVRREHYSGGGSNTAVYTLGVFPADEWFGVEPIAVSWWLPPTPACGRAVWPDDCQAVLSLSRLVCEPHAPKNTPSFLLAHGMKFIDRQRWPILITFADDWQGHTGAIYRAAGWIECGRSKPEPTYTIGGRMVCRKAGPVTRTHRQMLDLGCTFEGRFSRRRFVHVRTDLRERFKPIQARLAGGAA